MVNLMSNKLHFLFLLMLWVSISQCQCLNVMEEAQSRAGVTRAIALHGVGKTQGGTGAGQGRFLPCTKFYDFVSSSFHPTPPQSHAVTASCTHRAGALSGRPEAKSQVCPTWTKDTDFCHIMGGLGSRGGRVLRFVMH